MGCLIISDCEDLAAPIAWRELPATFPNVAIAQAFPSAQPAAHAEPLHACAAPFPAQPSSFPLPTAARTSAFSRVIPTERSRSESAEGFFFHNKEASDGQH